VSLLSIDMDRSFIVRMYHLGPRVALNFDQMMPALAIDCKNGLVAQMWPAASPRAAGDPQTTH
jgi:hypothetical protein